jgi:type 1 glutamine amidotransferase
MAETIRSVSLNATATHSRGILPMPAPARGFSLLFAVALLSAPRLIFADEAAAADGFKPIFNGKDLDGWDGDPRFWRVEDGAITGETTSENPTRGNTFIIWRQGELDDFELRLEYRIFGGNSGIQYRSFEDEKSWGKWVIGGYQADFEAGDTWSGALYGERYRGILAARGEKTVIGSDHKRKVVGAVGDSREIQSHIKKEDWNEYRVTARGFHLVHEINGRATAEASDEDEEMRRRSGLLAFQLHAGPPMKVQFRNVRLKRLEVEGKKKLVFVAGSPSHGYGAHEHNAGCLLLKKALDENLPAVHSTVYRSGWPKDPTAFDNADAIVLYMNGGDGHPVNRRLEEIDALMKKGVGLACLHYAVEVPKGKPGDYFLDWIGGYFETHWSVNPHWTLEKTVLAKDHPITRGVEPFAIHDEWYYHMRFRPEMEGVTPIITATPPESTLSRPDGPHSGNPHVRAKKGQPHAVAWARQRPGGGRGFGFTGGHDHWNWGHDGFRKLVLNALVWISGAEVPPGGVPSRTPTREELEANQDYPKPAGK